MRRTPLALVIALLIVVSAAGTAIARSGLVSTDAQANQPQVAGVADSNTSARFPTNKQNEPTVAIAPDGRHAIAGSNDEQKQPACGAPPRTNGPTDCSFFPEVGTSGVYTSADGGATWTNQGLLPSYTDVGLSVARSAGPLGASVAPGTLISDGDAVVVFGPQLKNGTFDWKHGTRAYYANLAAYSNAARPGNQQAEMIAVSLSDDLGGSWYDPIVAAQSNGNVFNDKEDIWVDRNPTSPFFGRVYVSYTEFRSGPGTAEPVVFVYSADGGLTWSKQNQLSQAYNNASRGGRQGSVIRTGPRGEVYVVFEDGDNVIGSQQVAVVSLDGGLTFSKKITISAVNDIQDPIPGANFRTDSFASAGVDQLSGAVYVAWADRTTTGSGRIVVSRGTDQGQTWSRPVAVSAGLEGYAFFQGLDVAPNGRVDIGYQALTSRDPATFGTGNASINSYYVASTNGVTWSAPLKVSTAPSDPAASAQNNLALQFWGDYNTVASTTTNVLFIYTDSRNGAGCVAVDNYQRHTVSKPAVGTPGVCPPQFGNTDLYVSKITP